MLLFYHPLIHLFLSINDLNGDLPFLFRRYYIVDTRPIEDEDSNFIVKVRTFAVFKHFTLVNQM